MKKLGVIIFMLTGCWCKAQVLLNLQLPQVGLHIKPQLWGCTLTNAGTQSVQVRIDLTMTDVAGSQQVMAASTSMITLPPGSRQLQANDLLPIQYNILNNGYGMTADPDGFLPVGNFVLCYNILQQANEGFDKVAEECETVEIEPIGPPVLLNPDNGSELYENHPVFSWLPPTLSNTGTNLLYSLTLVEISNGQAAADAIQQNMPLCPASNISGLSFAYPATAAPLDTAKTYAWQVTAYNNGLYTGRSEIFTFRLNSSEQPGVLTGSPVYTRLRQGDVLPFTVINGTLRIAYTHTAADTLVQLTIYDISKKENRPVVFTKTDQPVQRGDNYITLNLLDKAALRNGHLYVVELRNSVAETWALNFMYKQSD